MYRYDGSQFLRYGAEQGIPDRIIDKLFVGLDGTLLGWCREWSLLRAQRWSFRPG